ncbi:TRAP transporter substrate-binding protein [Salinarimonas soli]|nr:TRAP transporter substrate-binding protein [Salinarimonas soli]
MLLHHRARAHLAHLRRRITAGVQTFLLAAALACATHSHADQPVALRVIGGFGNVAQYKQYEEPFWTTRLPVLSGGRITANIRPFDQASIRAVDMLHLMRIGVVPFGNGLFSIVATDDPQLNGLDLPALSPTISDARRVLEAYRPHLRQVLAERYNIELLGVYTYSAQVLFCSHPFRGLDDLAGRKIRTSSVGQSELLRALGANPVQLPFAEILSAVSQGVVDCAVTGALSGAEIGLPRVMTHVHAMALSWGMSFFGANRDVWVALSSELQDVIRAGVAELEAQIWSAADDDTQRILAPAQGRGEPKASATTVVPASTADEVLRRRLVLETVLPSWFQRCGGECEEAWEHVLAPVVLKKQTLR